MLKLNTLNLKKINYLKLVLYCLIAIVTFWIATIPLGKINAFDVLWWLDIPFHIFGGFIFANIGVAIINPEQGIFNFEVQNEKRAIAATVYNIFIFVLLIGIVWEIYEYSMYYYGYVIKWGGLSDTIQDVGNDMLGALIVCYNRFKLLWLN